MNQENMKQPAKNQETGDRLARTIEDVKQVMALALAGNAIPQIAAQLNLDPQYVYNIQITAQGFHEDDEIAVAHLVMME